MKNLEEFFTEGAILDYLCKLRARVAKKRNEKHLIHLLSDSGAFNYHVNDEVTHSKNEYIEYQKKFISDLCKLLPSRKQWVKLGKSARLNSRTSQPISSNDKNVYSLLKTIKKARKNGSSAPWLKELNAFISDVKISVIDGNYLVSPPVIYPKSKDKITRNKKSECRPISLYTLKDRVIMSIANKYLTSLLDRYFENSSFAFRSKNKEGTTLTHHDCIREIVSFRTKNEGKDLWVVECDMDKFFDSVSHRKIMWQFAELILKVQNDYPELDMSKSILLFEKYLNSYCFNKDVLPLNDDSSYWSQYKIQDGEFGWVASQFKNLGYYDDFEAERIGIPQGGALSGLIANIVLDAADKTVKETDVLYVRFCDDMIILHPDKEECEKAKEVYIQSLRELKLVPHSFCEVDRLTVHRKKQKKHLPKDSIEPFWKEKSKGPYRWGSIEKQGFPWIGFVGYEIHHSGLIRVRKKSFAKELVKQVETIEKIRKAIRQSRRKSVGYITESAIHRLVGMSVGRIGLKNFNATENDLCWKNGFKELTLNKYSAQQMKHLDRNRNKIYYDFVRELEEVPDEIKESDGETSKRRQVIHFNKPFSYFYQVLERKQIL